MAAYGLIDEELQRSLIVDTLVNTGIRQSLGKSILSSSERKRGALFASIAEHASLPTLLPGVNEADFDSVRVLGDFINPSMLNSNLAGEMQNGENLGRLLTGKFSRKQSNCSSKRSAIYDEITFRWI